MLIEHMWNESRLIDRTWITSVEYVSKHFTAMKNFLISIPVNGSKAARNAAELMEVANVVRYLGIFASLSFLT